MDLQKVRLVSVVIFVCLLPCIANGQANAVGGSVRIRKSETVIANLTVTVAQMPGITDKTSERDGVYVLSVPKSLQKFDLVYQHPNFLRATDADISNEQAQNKRPVVEMRPNGASALGALSEKELDQVIVDAQLMTYRGISQSLQIVFDAGRANLVSLITAAESLNDEASQQSKAGFHKEAEEKYLKSIDIQQKVDPRNPRLARTLENYAALLRSANRKDDADAQMARAAIVRKSFFGSYYEFFGSYYKNEPLEFMRDYADAFDPNYLAQAARLKENEADIKATERFAIDNAGKIPNIEQTIVPLLAAGRQFGRLSVSSGRSASFGVYVRQGNVTLLRLLHASKSEFDTTVSDVQGVQIGEAVDDAVIWRATKTGIYTITVFNKTARSQDFVVSLSLRRDVLFENNLPRPK